MNKTIILYRYKLSYGVIENAQTFKVERETPLCYFTEGNRRFMKEEDGKAVIKDRTSYPYIDFWSANFVEKNDAVKAFKNFFEGWGLREEA